MITRFRVEGKHDDKEQLAQELALHASRIIGAIGQEGEWECTDDVISRVKPAYGAGKKLKKYTGRMVFMFHKNPDAETVEFHIWDDDRDARRWG